MDQNQCAHVCGTYSLALFCITVGCYKPINYEHDLPDGSMMFRKITMLKLFRKDPQKLQDMIHNIFLSAVVKIQLRSLLLEEYLNISY